MTKFLREMSRLSEFSMFRSARCHAPEDMDYVSWARTRLKGERYDLSGEVRVDFLRRQVFHALGKAAFLSNSDLGMKQIFFAEACLERIANLDAGAAENLKKEGSIDSIADSVAMKLYAEVAELQKNENSVPVPSVEKGDSSVAISVPEQKPPPGKKVKKKMRMQDFVLPEPSPQPAVSNAAGPLAPTAVLDAPAASKPANSKAPQVAASTSVARGPVVCKPSAAHKPTAEAVAPEVFEPSTSRRCSPIFLEPSSSPTSLIAEIISSTGKEYEFRVCGKMLRVNPKGPDDHHTITKLLEEKGIPFHTLPQKESRLLRVIVRGLHQLSTTAEISDELLRLGFTITKVTQMGGKDARLPLFLVSLPGTAFNRSILQLRILMSQIVTVTKFKPTPGPVQCFRCQRFGHGTSSCHMNERCVICGGAHQSAVCKRPKAEAATCCNCGGPHPASHRLCSFWVKEKQLASGHNTRPSTSDACPAASQPATSSLSGGRTYAAVASKARSPQPDVPSNTIAKLLSNPKLLDLLAVFRELAEAVSQ